MNIVICDNGDHDFATRKVLRPLLSYRKDIKLVNSLSDIRNSRIIAYYSYFKPQEIVRLKEQGNKLFSIDVNDSSYLGSCYMNSEEALLLDKIFKFSGLQTRRYSDQLMFGNDMSFCLEERSYSPDKEWTLLQALNDKSKIVPMPHVPWFTVNEQHIRPWEERKKKVLIRGGLHFYRFVLYLKLLQYGKVDQDSNFHMKMYFDEKMPEHFRFCEQCRKIFNENGRRLSYDNYVRNRFDCKERFMDWQKEQEFDFFIKNHPTVWNNACLPFFYNIADRFEKTHGEIDRRVLEEALHGDFLDRESYWKILTSNAFYADYKWLFCIDIPPRFWEAAGAKTLTYLPKWTNNQFHFYNLKENEHYLSFDEDLGNVERMGEVTKEQYEHITNNCKSLYDYWIKFDQYDLNVNLMNYIMEVIENG